MLTKNEILSKISYKITEKTFFFIGDDISQNDFDLEKDETIIVFYKKSKNLFLFSNIRLHYKDLKGESKSVPHSEISGKELKICLEENSYTLKIFVKVSNKKRLHISLKFDKYDEANVTYEILDFIPSWFRSKSIQKKHNRINEITISVLEETWERDLTEKEKENPTKVFTEHLKTLNINDKKIIMKKLLRDI